MKIATVLFLVLMLNFVNFAFADCATEVFDDRGLRANVITLTSSNLKMNNKQVQAWKKYFTYSELDQYCIDLMKVSQIKAASGKVYTVATTHYDECDGGNVMGLVYDSSDNIVVEISDGQFYCPN